MAVRPTVGYQDKQGALKIHLHPWKGMVKIEDAPRCGPWCLQETPCPGPGGRRGPTHSSFLSSCFQAGSVTAAAPDCKTGNQDNIASFSGLVLVLSLLSLSSLKQKTGGASFFGLIFFYAFWCHSLVA